MDAASWYQLRLLPIVRPINVPGLRGGAPEEEKEEEGVYLEGAQQEDFQQTISLVMEKGTAIIEHV
jgi:hypothetical protein